MYIRPLSRQQSFSKKCVLRIGLFWLILYPIISKYFSYNYDF